MTPASDTVRRLDPDPRVVTVLDRRAIPHRVVRHAELEGTVGSALDVARLLEIGPDRITKTLLVTDRQDHFGLVVVPVLSRVEFAAVSGRLGWTRATMAPPAALAAQLGQPVDGVSPLGHHHLPVVVDATLGTGAAVLVGAGTPGVEIMIDPQALLTATGAICTPVARR